jgi:hypothetical protein
MPPPKRALKQRQQIHVAIRLRQSCPDCVGWHVVENCH